MSTPLERIANVEAEDEATDTGQIWTRIAAAKYEPRIAELEAELADWREASRRIMAEECAPDEKHCTCVPALREEIERLKNQAAHYSKAMWAIDREKNGYAEQVERLQAMIPTKPEGADRLFWLMKPVLAKPFVLGEED